ncbi:CD99 antigen-like protein 2 [Pteropus vampyrus]|uniref:CD99 antigen-like protein 2 n=1 Tax=Pteropus vampyrus TaxID=132908 RepID=A0A6P3RI91_PTEVA|nr:CD99 antigen-like protein 2 [Pteropus vampyrus]
MAAWRSAFLICLAFSLATLIQRGSGDLNDLDLRDALKETASVKQKWDYTTTTTKRPGTTRAPAKPAGSDFDLSDALDNPNDRFDGRRKPSAGGGGFSDKDLEDVLGGDYKPDKGRDAAEGQEGLNADYVKGENLEAVVCEEPQVKYSALPPQSAEPPQPQPPRI